MSGGKTPRGEESVKLSVSVPISALAALHRDADSFAREMRLAAAIKWYECRLVSQGRAAEIAGVSRAELLQALNRYSVSPFQATVAELVSEAGG